VAIIFYKSSCSFSTTEVICWFPGYWNLSFSRFKMLLVIFSGQGSKKTIGTDSKSLSKMRMRSHLGSPQKTQHQKIACSAWIQDEGSRTMPECLQQWHCPLELEPERVVDPPPPLNATPCISSGRAQALLNTSLHMENASPSSRKAGHPFRERREAPIANGET
jgi:hypothetical protein